MGNIHFTEIFDFFVGWLTLDFSRDDWATRIADEERALNGKDPAKPQEPAKGPDENPPNDPAKEPPKALPPKPAPAEDPPPAPRPKDPPPKPGSHRHGLEDIIP